MWRGVLVLVLTALLCSQPSLARARPPARPVQRWRAPVRRPVASRRRAPQRRAPQRRAPQRRAPQRGYSAAAGRRTAATARGGRRTAATAQGGRRTGAGRRPPAGRVYASKTSSSRKAPPSRKTVPGRKAAPTKKKDLKKTFKKDLKSFKRDLKNLKKDTKKTLKDTKKKQKNIPGAAVPVVRGGVDPCGGTGRTLKGTGVFCDLSARWKNMAAKVTDNIQQKTDSLLNSDKAVAMKKFTKKLANTVNTVGDLVGESADVAKNVAGSASELGLKLEDTSSLALVSDVAYQTKGYSDKVNTVVSEKVATKRTDVQMEDQGFQLGNEKVREKVGTAAAWLARRKAKATEKLGKLFGVGSKGAALLSNMGSRAQQIGRAVSNIGDIAGKFGAVGLQEKIAKVSDGLNSVGQRASDYGDSLGRKVHATESMTAQVDRLGQKSSEALTKLGLSKEVSLSNDEETPSRRKRTKLEALGRMATIKMLGVRKSFAKYGLVSETAGSSLGEKATKLAERANMVASVAADLTGKVASVGAAVSTVGGLFRSNKLEAVGSKLGEYAQKSATYTNDAMEVTGKLHDSVSTVASNVADLGRSTREIARVEARLEQNTVKPASPVNAWIRSKVEKLGGRWGQKLLEKLKVSDQTRDKLRDTSAGIAQLGVYTGLAAEGATKATEKLNAFSTFAGNVMSNAGNVVAKGGDVLAGAARTSANIAKALGMNHLEKRFRQGEKIGDKSAEWGGKLQERGDKLQGLVNQVTSVTVSVANGANSAGALLHSAGHTIDKSLDGRKEEMTVRRPNWVQRMQMKLQTKLNPGIQKIQDRASDFNAKMSKFGNKVVQNPLVQHLGHVSLKGLNKGLRGSAKVFETLDKGVEWAAKKTYKAISKVGETAVGKAISAKANAFLDSKIGQRVTRTLDEMKAISGDISAPIEKVKEYLGDKYVNLGTKFRIDEKESRQAVKDFGTTASGIARYAPVAMSIGAGVSQLANLGVVAREAGMRTAANMVKDQIVDAAKNRLSSWSASGASEHLVRSFSDQIPLAGVSKRINNLLDNRVAKLGFNVADKVMTGKRALDDSLNTFGEVRDKVGAVYDYGKALTEQEEQQKQQTEEVASDQSFEQQPPQDQETFVTAPAA